MSTALGREPRGDNKQNGEAAVWRMSPLGWAAMIGALVLAGVANLDALQHMVSVWLSSDEYGYAFFIPAITLFLIWQRANRLERTAFVGSWTGVIAILVGIGFSLAGNLATLYVVVQYALLLTVIGAVLAFVGWRAMRAIFVPLLFLAFMIPLPVFIYNNLSAKLQLVSSQIGVAIIKAFGVSVFLEGNVIDLGVMKLQVAEACSGLRFLFPLMALGFIAAYFFRGALWKRVLIFVSTIPITVLMNGVRIGAIGVLVEHGGQAMAEGFLHDFEGWFVFMVCTALLVLEMWLLANLGRDRLPLGEAFGLSFPDRAATGTQRHRPIPRPFVGAFALLCALAVVSIALPQRVEASPQRKSFFEFPLTLDDWRGRAIKIDAVYASAITADDYLVADFVDGKRRPVNLYVAYYASQRKGQSVHSPNSCIPGDGWEIRSLTQRAVDGVLVGGRPLKVNRVTIQKGDNAQLVYYWFLQRGRVVTNEYLVKWYLFWDALTRNRTDGAMLRLITPISGLEPIELADERIAAFARTLSPRLASFVPE